MNLSLKIHQLFECGQENSYVIYLHRLMKKNKHFCQNETKKKKKKIEQMIKFQNLGFHRVF